MVAGADRHNRYGFGSSKKPINKPHQMSYLMGIRTSGRLIPVRVLNREILVKICSSAGITVGTKRTPDKVHRAIICHVLNETLTNEEKFNRSVIEPLEQYIQRNPDHYSYYDGVLCISNNSGLNLKLSTIRVRARKNELSNRTRDRLNQSPLLNGCWERTSVHRLSDEAIHSLGMENIRVSESECHFLHSRGVKGWSSLGEGAFELNTRFEGIAEEGSDVGER